MNHKKLTQITDEDAITCAQIAKIEPDYEFKRETGQDKGCIDIIGRSKRGKPRSLRIYFNGSNTRVINDGWEVIEYCFEIYDYLRSIGYDVQPNKKLPQLKNEHKKKKTAKEKEEVSAYSEEFYSRIKNYPDLPK